MAPTVQSGSSREDRERRFRHGERRSELVCRVKYNNTLPDIPFDPKFILYPFESTRFVQYNPTSLERTYKHELLTEHDLGITIDLINPETYKIDRSAFLEPEDERLLEEEVNAPADSKRSQHHSKNVSWLRKTEYISTEYNRFTPSADKAEARVGFSTKNKFKEEDLYRDRDSQIQAIEKTFEEANKPLTKHYSKPGVHPVDVMPVFPDFNLWKHAFAQVIFDTDPAGKGKQGTAQLEEMSQAMIRGMVDEAGDQFVAYFLPTDETLGKRKRDVELEQDYQEDDEYDYTLAREYNWNVKNKSTQGYEENYFFVFKQDGVYYNELETRVRLSKRRKAGAGPTTGAPTSNSRLIVKHRPLNDAEVGAQDARLTMLEPPQEEEEEEEEMPMVEEDNPFKSGEEDNAEEGEGEKEENENEDNEEKAGGSESEGEREGEKEEEKEGEEEEEKEKDVGSPRSSRSGSRRSSSSSSGSGSGSSSAGSGSEKGSDSESEGEEEKKKDAEEIFGSESDSD